MIQEDVEYLKKSLVFSHLYYSESHLIIAKVIFSLIEHWLYGVLHWQIKSGEELGVHLVLDDPTGNSYLQVLISRISELQIRESIEDNSKIIFLVSQQKHKL